MNLTEDQRYFMDILETAGFVRAGQVLPLPRINEPGKEPNHAEAPLPLEDAAQHQQITLARGHYFILRHGDNLRFYKGGEAGK